MKRKLSLNHCESLSVEVEKLSAHQVRFLMDGQVFTFEIVKRGLDGVVLRDKDGRQHQVFFQNSPSGFLAVGNGLDVEIKNEKSVAKVSQNSGGLVSPMPGKVFRLLVKTGDTVTKGQILMVIEAMKMEHPIKSDREAVVKSINFKEGDLVQGGVALLELT